MSRIDDVLDAVAEYAASILEAYDLELDLDEIFDDDEPEFDLSFGYDDDEDNDDEEDRGYIGYTAYDIEE